MNHQYQADPGIIKSLQDAHNILCVSHVSPDGDAVGSLTGIGQILQRLEKRVTLALQDEVPAEFINLPGAENIIGPGKVENYYDLIICVDASSPDRMGKVYRESRHRTIPLAVIDHHITNTYFWYYELG